MKNIVTKITISLILISILSSCKNEYREYDTSNSIISSVTHTESTTVNPYDYNTKVVIGIETVPYPNPQSVYMYDKLTEDQKIAYNALADFAAMVIENNGQERLEYPLSKPINNQDMSLAKDLYESNFMAQYGIVHQYINEIQNYEEMKTYSLYFEKDGLFDEEFRIIYTRLKQPMLFLHRLRMMGLSMEKLLQLQNGLWIMLNIRMTIQI